MILAFNIKKEKRKKDQNIEQEEKETKLVNNILGLYRLAYDTKQPLHEVWEECFKGYTGELFKKDLPSYRSQEVSNFIFSTIETIKPIMLSNNPEIVALPSTPDDLQKAEMVRDVLKYEWDRTNMFSLLQKMLTTGLIYGTAIIGLFWNGNKNNIGQVEPVVISPFNFFPDPMAENINDGQFVIYATYKSIKDVIEFAPEKEEEIRKNATRPDDKFLTFGKEVDNVSGDQNILYIEAYVKDYTVDIEEYEEDGEKKQKSKMKYPNGRRIIIAGDVLIRDEENPYNDFGSFPFVTWKCYDIPGRQWGMGEVEQILSPTIYASTVMNHILETTRLMSNPVWILDKNAGVTKNSLTNRDGLVIRKNPGTEVRREAPPSLPAYVVNLPDMLLDHVEHISGVYDVTRGEKPGGVTAAAAIQALNEQSQGRIKLKVQSMEKTLSELGSMWLRRIQQFWVSERLIRILPDALEEPRFEGVNGEYVDGDWDIIIAAGSTMQSNKTAMAQQLIQLAQTPAEDGLPMIDRQTLLENSDIPGVSRIIERFKAIRANREQAEVQQMEAQQLQAEQQMQMQQAMKQQEAEMKHQQQMEDLKMKHEFELENKLVDHDLASQQNQEQIQERELGLQNENLDLLSNQDIEGLDSATTEQQEILAVVEELIPLLQSMSPDELLELMEEIPELEQLIQLLSQQQNTEQSLE